jgi:hypothetical protein
MKFSVLAVSAVYLSGVSGFFTPASTTGQRFSCILNMVLEMPTEKKISKLETLKVSSDHLIHPLKEVRCFLVKMKLLVVSECDWHGLLAVDGRILRDLTGSMLSFAPLLRRVAWGHRSDEVILSPSDR